MIKDFDTASMHPAAAAYADEVRAGTMTRREFLTRTSALGVSAAGAYGLLGMAAPTPVKAQAMGVPLAPVMAFWLASPLMDPSMFALTTGTLGFDFAIAKTAAAVLIGLLGGFGTMVLKSSPVFADPLREKPAVGGCCGVGAQCC